MDTVPGLDRPHNEFWGGSPPAIVYIVYIGLLPEIIHFALVL